MCIHTYSRAERDVHLTLGVDCHTTHFTLHSRTNWVCKQHNRASLIKQTHTLHRATSNKAMHLYAQKSYITFKVTYTEWFHCSNGTALAVSWCSQPSHALSLALDTLKYGEEHLVVWPTTVPLRLHHSHHLWQAHSCQDPLTLVLRTHWSEERKGSWTMW